MSTMSDNETYNGYANRETWAFNLHWQNDRGLYSETLAYAGEWISEHETRSNTQIGEAVVSYWRELITEWREDRGTELPEGLEMMCDEVGSWWRIDYAEVGEAVRESLEAEGE